MIKHVSTPQRKRNVQRMVDEQMPEHRTVAAWEFHLLPGLLLWVVICWRGHRTLGDSYKFLGVFPVVVLYTGNTGKDEQGKSKEYQIFAPSEE